MDIKKADTISSIIQHVSYILLLVTCIILINQEHSKEKDWDFSFFAIFWANHLLIVLSILLRKKNAPYRHFFYLKVPQICSACLGILINTVFIIQGKIGESGLIYILPMLWPIYIGFFYYIVIVVIDLYFTSQTKQKIR